MKKGDIGHSSALYVWNGFSVFWGMSFNTSPHHHDTLQLVFDIERTFRLRDEATDWREYSAAIIRDGHTHQLDSNGSMQLFLYLDKDSHYSRQLAEKYLAQQDMNDLSKSDIRKLSHDFFRKLLAESYCDKLFRGYITILRHLIDMDTPEPMDKRVEQAIDFIVKKRTKPITIGDVARHVCLSESRIRHLFKHHVGQPIQNFMLWMKVVDSLNRIVRGSKVEEAAYATGFWDASHMNRVYKTLLGVTPGAISQLDDSTRIVSCSNKNFYIMKTTILNNWQDATPATIIKV